MCIYEGAWTEANKAAEQAVTAKEPETKQPDPPKSRENWPGFDKDEFDRFFGRK